MIRIRHKLLFGLIPLVMIAVGSSGWFLYFRAKTSLEADLSKRLIAIAQAAAIQFDPDIIMRISPGDDRTRSYLNTIEKLDRLARATGVARIYLFDRQGRSIADTNRAVSIGDEYVKFRFDRRTLDLLWRGESSASLLFRGHDGRYYKSGYAPVKSGNEVVAGVGVDMSADFLDTMREFKRSVVLFVFLGAVAVIAIGYLLAWTITINLKKLVRAAQRIGEGDLETPIDVRARDEIGYLARSMSDMQKGILRRDEQMKMMLANVAHEIKNPLAGIELSAGIIAEQLGPDHEAGVYNARIMAEASNLKRLIDQFLEFARPPEPAKTLFDLKELLLEIYLLMTPELSEHQIDFSMDVPDGMRIFADRRQIKSVMFNLFRNAIQAMVKSDRPRELRVIAETCNGEIVIRVSDTGVGISKENLGRLFEPFFTTKEKGAGLGLALVLRNVSANGGIITVESTPGEGTTFIIRFPRGFNDE